jgi:hypothetical protein
MMQPKEVFRAAISIEKPKRMRFPPMRYVRVSTAASYLAN